MAGDWIKMRVDLADDPAVIKIAARLNLCEDTVVGKIHRLWSWFDQQTTNGNAPGVTSAWIDRRCNCPGLAAAMIEVEWLIESADGMQMPDFDKHNGQSGKSRALGSKRTQKSRARCNAATVTESDGHCVTEPLPEKRREDSKDNHTSHSANGPRDTFLTGYSENFKRFQVAYPKNRDPDEAWRVWQATVIALVGTNGWTDDQAELWLIERAAAYAASPAGKPPPIGQTEDFRPTPAKWLKNGKFREPDSEWQTPNVKGSQNGDSHQRRAAGPRKRTAAAEAVRPDPNAEDFDALFDRVATGKPAGGLETPTASGISQSG